MLIERYEPLFTPNNIFHDMFFWAIGIFSLFLNHITNVELNY